MEMFKIQCQCGRICVACKCCLEEGKIHGCGDCYPLGALTLIDRVIAKYNPVYHEAVEMQDDDRNWYCVLTSIGGRQTVFDTDLNVVTRDLELHTVSHE